MPKEKKNFSKAIELYESGQSIAVCASYYGITRQAMWKILIRRGVQMRSNIRTGGENHFYRGGSRRSPRVPQVVTLAREKGLIVPSPCEVCGHSDAGAHHDDYNKPLAVRWLCDRHHFEWHRHHVASEATEEIPKMTQREVASLGGRTYIANHSQEDVRANAAKARAARIQRHQ